MQVQSTNSTGRKKDCIENYIFEQNTLCFNYFIIFYLFANKYFKITADHRLPLCNGEKHIRATQLFIDKIKSKYVCFFI